MAIISLAGCTFLKQSDQIGYISYAKIDSRIKYYEKTRVLPCDKGIPNPNIAELYAYRSTCRAQADPVFEFSRVTLLLAKEFTCEENLYLGWIGPSTFLPIALVYDVLLIPVQATRTVRFSKINLYDALSDLKRARELGYKEKDIFIGPFMFDKRGIHLDKLGFKINDYK